MFQSPGRVSDGNGHRWGESEGLVDQVGASWQRPGQSRVPDGVQTPVGREAVRLERLVMALVVAREDEAAQGQAAFGGSCQAGVQVGIDGLAGQVRVAEQHVRERMAADLLLDPRALEHVQDVIPVPEWVPVAVRAGVDRVPVAGPPALPRPDELRMGQTGRVARA